MQCRGGENKGAVFLHGDPPEDLEVAHVDGPGVLAGQQLAFGGDDLRALHLLRQVRFPPFHRASVPSSPWRLAPPAGDFLDSLLAWGKWRNPWLNAACGLGFEYQGSLARTLPPWVLGGFFRKIG